MLHVASKHVHQSKTTLHLCGVSISTPEGVTFSRQVFFFIDVAHVAHDNFSYNHFQQFSHSVAEIGTATLCGRPKFGPAQ